MGNADQQASQDLPKSWYLATLGELAAIHSGSTPRRDVPRYWNGEIPWVTPGEVSDHDTKYLTATKDRITESGLASCSTTLLPIDSLLVTTRATLGSVVLAAVPVTTNQGFRSLVFGPKADPHFFYHLSHRLVGEFKRRASGTTFLEISGREFAAVEVPLPSLPEQRCIARILDTVDQAIHKTDQVIAKLQCMKQGLLSDLVTRGIDHNGELRHPDWHPEQFNNSALGRIPASWEVAELGDLAQVTKLAGYEYTNFIRYTPSGEVIAIRPTNIKHERLDLTEIQRIERSVSNQLPRSKVRAFDVLLTYIGAYIGDTLLIKESNRFHLAPNICRISAYRALEPEWLLWILRHETTRRQIAQLTSVTATPSLTMSQIRKLRLPVPPTSAEQMLMAKRMASLVQRIETEAGYVSKLRSLKDGLMNDLLTGRVRVRIGEEAST